MASSVASMFTRDSVEGVAEAMIRITWEKRRARVWWFLMITGWLFLLFCLGLLIIGNRGGFWGAIPLVVLLLFSNSGPRFHPQTVREDNDVSDKS